MGDWWLAGRSLRPVQESWARQRGFVANASHELRAPLTLLRASAEVALRRTPEADAERRALLGDVLDECDHMARLVHDLLLLSRLDARRLPLDCRAVPLAPRLADVARQVARADAARLRQVLLILLDNALRHTPCGGRITLVARAEGPRAWRSPTPARASRPSTCPTSSSASTAPRGRARRPARALVEAQRGAIGVASQPGRGTTVSITLPAAP